MTHGDEIEVRGDDGIRIRLRPAPDGLVLRLAQANIPDMLHATEQGEQPRNEARRKVLIEKPGTPSAREPQRDMPLIFQILIRDDLVQQLR